MVESIYPERPFLFPSNCSKSLAIIKQITTLLNITVSWWSSIKCHSLRPQYHLSNCCSYSLSIRRNHSTHHILCIIHLQLTKLTTWSLTKLTTTIPQTLSLTQHQSLDTMQLHMAMDNYTDQYCTHLWTRPRLISHHSNHCCRDLIKEWKLHIICDDPSSWGSACGSITKMFLVWTDEIKVESKNR